MSRTIPSVLTLVFCVSLSIGTLGAQDPERVVIGTERTIHSDILGEDRDLLIHTPDGYDRSDARYPVLLLLDGAAHFHHTTASADFLAENARIPELIVVGIRNTDRTRDLTPSAPSELFAGLETAGGAAQFLRFLTEELVPWLDSTYRTRPLRLLIGHSFGGLFAVYALQHRPNFFRGVIAISPSMQWDDQRLVRETERWLDKKPKVESAIYLTAGNEGGGLLGGTHEIAGIFSEKAPASLRWKFVPMPGETHNSVPLRSTYDGLEFLFEGWWARDPVGIYDIGGVDGFRDHYARVRRRFGYEAEMSAMTWFTLIHALIAAGRLDDARDVAVAGGAAIPPPAWNFLADEYRRRGDEAGATICYQRCLDAHPFHQDARKKLIARGIEPPPMPRGVEVPEDLLRAYAGRYRLTKYSLVLTVTLQDGGLWFETTGQERSRLHARSTTEFVSDGGMELRFARDDAGKGQLTIVMGQLAPCERLSDESDDGSTGH